MIALPAQPFLEQKGVKRGNCRHQLQDGKIAWVEIVVRANLDIHNIDPVALADEDELTARIQVFRIEREDQLRRDTPLIFVKPPLVGT